MVRIIKIEHLEEQRRELVIRSEMYRQVLHLEVTSLKISASELKHRFSSARRWFGLAASVAGIIQRPAGSQNSNGLLSRLLSGLKIGAEFARLFSKSGDSNTTGKKSGDRPTAPIL